MPFGRPTLQEMLSAIDFVLQTGYPARGVAVAEGNVAEYSYTR
jgi:hypothetical protein